MTAAAKVARGMDSFFLMLSTAKLDIPADYPGLMQSAATLQTNVASLLSSCPTAKYALVSLPNLYLDDVWANSDHVCPMNDLCQAARDLPKGYMVANVKGKLPPGAVAEQIRSSCSAAGKTVDVVTKKMSGLPVATSDEFEGEGAEDKRKAAMKITDADLATFISTLGADYALLLIADPNDFEPYESTFANALHPGTNHSVIISQKGGNTTVDHRALFEKYQFFTPGVFMGLIAFVVMISILGVGLKALSSLEVSYGAFEKEMGPAAQKKNL